MAESQHHNGVIVGVQVASEELERFRHTLNASLGTPLPRTDLVVPLMTTGEIIHYDQVEPDRIASAAEPINRALDRANLVGKQVDIVPGSLTPMYPFLSLRLLPTDELAFARSRTARILSRRIRRSLDTGLGGLWLNITQIDKEPDPTRLKVINEMGRLPTAVVVTDIVNGAELVDSPLEADDFASQPVAQECRGRYRRHEFAAMAQAGR